MAFDRFQSARDALSAPSDVGRLVTPNDSADLAEVPKCIHIGGTDADPAEGSIVWLDRNGTQLTSFGRRGDFMPIRPHRILETGTTPGLVIIALY